MVDLAVIGIAVDTTDLQDGKAALNQFAVTGEATERRVKKSMKGVEVGIESAGRASRGSTMGLRNLGLQLNQIGQQGAVTGNYMQAIGTQLPDILLGFGAWGIAAGVVASILPTVAGALFEASGGVEAFDEAMEGLNESLRDYNRAVDNADFDNLVDQFGQVTPQIIEMQRAIQELRIREVMLDAADAMKALSDSFNFDGFLTTGGMELQRIFHASLGEVAQIQALLSNIGQADTFAGQIAAINELQAKIEDITGGVGNMNREQLEFLGRTRDAEAALRLAAMAAGEVEAAVGGAALNAGALATNAQAALSALSQANAQAAKDALVYGGRGADPRLFMEGGSRAGSGGKFVFTPPKATKSGGGAKIDPRQREAEQWFDKTRTAAEKYAIELADLNELQDMGYLKGDTYSRALESITKAYKEASEQGQFFSDLQEDFKNGFLDAIVAGESLSDVFDNLAKSIAKAALEAALFGSGPFAGGGSGGGLLGGLFSGLFGGFRASGGPVSSGKGYVVGERGPEWFMPSSNGSIMPNGSGGTVNVMVTTSEDLKVVAAEAGQGAAVRVVQAGFKRQREVQRRA